MTWTTTDSRARRQIRFDDLVGDSPGKIHPGFDRHFGGPQALHSNNSGGGKVYVHRIMADWDATNVSWDTAKLGGSSEGGVQADDKEATASFCSFESNRKGDFSRSMCCRR